MLIHRILLLAGKDYSNARVSDFHTLTKPDEDMYDRTKVPRMPWYVVITIPFPKIDIVGTMSVSKSLASQPEI